VGRNFGTITNSHAEVDVGIGSGNWAGGLVGYNTDTGKILDSYSNGDVSGHGTRIGGFVGENLGTIENSHYNIETVLINDDNHVTFGGLYDEQYEDWIQNDRYLNIEDYDTTLIPMVNTMRSVRYRGSKIC